MHREAKIPSKGQITVPREVRHVLGISPGHKIVFEQNGKDISVRPVRSKSVFAKYRGIGNPGLPSGRQKVVDKLHELRGRSSSKWSLRSTLMSSLRSGIKTILSIQPRREVSMQHSRARQTRN